MGTEREIDEADEADEALAQVMARLAEGDGAAIFTFRTRYEAELARLVRGIAASRGARLRAPEVEELVTEATLAIAHVAPAWRPGGAPPWVWARHRVAAAVDGYVGQWTDQLDDAAGGPEPVAPAASPGTEPPVVHVVAGLAETNALVALLHEAVTQVASPRDQVIFYEHGLQVSLGDRSPAATVAGLLGLRPEAVRQQQRRVRLRIQRLAEQEPRFAPLAVLPLVA